MKIIKHYENGNCFYDISANIDAHYAISSLRISGKTFDEKEIILDCDNPEKNIISITNEKLSFAKGGLTLEQLENKMLFSCILRTDIDKLNLINNNGFSEFSLEFKFSKRPEILRTFPIENQSQDIQAPIYIFFSEPMDWNTICNSEIYEGALIYEHKITTQPSKITHTKNNNILDNAILIKGENNTTNETDYLSNYVKEIVYVNDKTLKIVPFFDINSEFSFPLNSRIKLTFSETISSKNGIPFGKDIDFVWYTNIFTDSQSPSCNVKTEKYGPNYKYLIKISENYQEYSGFDLEFNIIKDFNYQFYKQNYNFNSFNEWTDYIFKISKVSISDTKDPDFTDNKQNSIIKILEATQYINKKYNKDYFDNISDINKSDINSEEFDLCFIFDGTDESNGSGINRYEIFEYIYDPNSPDLDKFNCIANALDRSSMLDNDTWKDVIYDFNDFQITISYDQLLNDNRFYLNPYIPEDISENTKSCLVLFIILCYDNAGNYSFTDQWIMYDLDQENRIKFNNQPLYAKNNNDKEISKFVLGD